MEMWINPVLVAILFVAVIVLVFKVWIKPENPLVLISKQFDIA
jgi:hypothetical protein